MTTQSVTVQVKHTIDRERLEDLLVGAFEGGSNYWIGHCKRERQGLPVGNLYDAAFADGLWIYPKDQLDRPRFLNLDRMRFGMTRLSEEHPRHMADILNGNDDATTADVWLQLCLFGEVVYG